MNRAYERTQDNAKFWRAAMDDPGADHLFDVAAGGDALARVRGV